MAIETGLAVLVGKIAALGGAAKAAAVSTVAAGSIGGAAQRKRRQRLRATPAQ